MTRTPDSNANLYKEAGVDVDRGDRLVEWLQRNPVEGPDTRFGKAVSGIGGFAALFRPDFRALKDPLIVTSTDGVGTKVLMGVETGRLSGLGIDLVAMCVNDLYTVGGRPLFFLDYYATGVLEDHQFKAVLTGIQAGCRQSGAALLGGETAELPGLYAKGHFDLAGFVVGVVDGATMLGADRVRPTDALYALPSSGFHSNGYSLLRKWVADRKSAFSPDLLGRLMEPTRIYHELPDILTAVGPEVLHAAANITGGGISGNLPRVLPAGTKAVISWGAVPTPGWMREVVELNQCTVPSLEGVFNLGCGMILAVADSGRARFESACKAAGIPPVRIGEIAAGAGEAHVEFVP